MSPDIGDAVYRFVLSWSDLPADLDIHLVTPEIGGQSYHLYWASTGSELSLPYAELDNDVTTGYGPETITIYQLESGTYTLYVHNYSENPSIITSEAVLQIYGNSGFVTNINVPTSGTGLYWDILTIDGTTEILTINNSIIWNNTIQTATSTLGSINISNSIVDCNQNFAKLNPELTDAWHGHCLFHFISDFI